MWGGRECKGCETKCGEGESVRDVRQNVGRERV